MEMIKHEIQLFQQKCLIFTGNQYSQVIVKDETGVNCTDVVSPYSKPDCPGQTLDTSTTTACIAKLYSTTVADSIVPDYLADLPVDPQGATVVPTANYLALGDNNSGYYIHKFTSGRIEVGSCYPDQTAVINVKR